ncbi:putative integral membrane protein [Frankia sp. Hr75.2]|uniref:SHOCT domain-containing protein n=1 Tax=Parafrankia sp. Ea1.12 TaxID=573499 RepID=UPI000DA54B40|nr:SHOCT domain-containing protein [Parafrankia sp. Ea1.12]CAI7978190.1 putative integral membrane protein [Frankia sp. Hr75.2]SQD97273.1 putative integral membrane protein [Parafrankia sp. Ea1.12]
MDYPLLSVFWTMLLFFGFVLWLYLLFIVVSDVFRSRDLSGWAKAGWLAAVIIIPLLGVLAYTIFRGDSMGERAFEDAQRQHALHQAFRPSAVQSQGVADEMAKLVALRRNGEISEEEFQQAKSRVLA